MLLLYLFSKYARFLIEHGMVYISLSPLFEQNKVFYYPGDPVDSNGIPIGINQNKPFRRFKGLTKLVLAYRNICRIITLKAGNSR